eukprot:6371320-Alexandrium_andersonii.AAC.1
MPMMHIKIPWGPPPPDLKLGTEARGSPTVRRFRSRRGGTSAHWALPVCVAFAPRPLLSHALLALLRRLALL